MSWEVEVKTLNLKPYPSWSRKCCSSWLSQAMQLKMLKQGDMLNGSVPAHILDSVCISLHNFDLWGHFHGRPFIGVLTKAVRVHPYIIQRPLLLNLLRRFTK